MNQVSVPEYLTKNLMFNRRVQIGRNEYFDIILTRGPRIYLTQANKQILTCDLSSTNVKDIECKQTDFTGLESPKTYDFDICFSYAGKVKRIFLLLKMRDKLIVMSKINDEISIIKQYENVRLFVLEEKYSEFLIRIEMIDGFSVGENLYRLRTDEGIEIRNSYVIRNCRWFVNVF